MCFNHACFNHACLNHACFNHVCFNHTEEKLWKTFQLKRIPWPSTREDCISLGVFNNFLNIWQCISLAMHFRVTTHRLRMSVLVNIEALVSIMKSHWMSTINTEPIIQAKNNWTDQCGHHWWWPCWTIKNWELLEEFSDDMMVALPTIRTGSQAVFLIVKDTLNMINV